MIKFKSITDREVWNQYLSVSSYAKFLQSWEWGEFQEGLGKRVERLGIYIDGELNGVCLVIFENSRFGNLAYCPRGPVIDWRNVSQSEMILRELVEHIKGVSPVTFVRIDPSVKAGDSRIESTISNSGFHNSVAFWQVERSWMLDLKGKSDDDLLSGMRKNSRYSLRKSMKSGVEVLESRDLNDIGEFADMLLGMAEKKGFSPLPKSYIVKQFEIMGVKYGMFHFYKAMINKKMVAGVITSRYKDEASYLHGASHATNDSQAPYLLQWHSIKDARDEGMDRYNFWGVVEDKNYHPGYPGFGYSNFKKGFGGYVEQYIRTKDYPIRKLPYFLFKLQERYRKWRYPGN